jgi:hypothetical protein
MHSFLPTPHHTSAARPASVCSVHTSTLLLCVYEGLKVNPIQTSGITLKVFLVNPFIWNPCYTRWLDVSRSSFPPQPQSVHLYWESAPLESPTRALVRARCCLSLPSEPFPIHRLIILYIIDTPFGPDPSVFSSAVKKLKN